MKRINKNKKNTSIMSDIVISIEELTEKEFLIEKGKTFIKGSVYYWGPNHIGRFLAGAECRYCGQEFIGMWSKMELDGDGAQKHDPHCKAAYESLCNEIAKHLCTPEIP